MKNSMEKLPKEPTPEELDFVIEQKLDELYEKYNDVIEIEGELADEWYWVEQEAKVAKNRKEALERLEAFINKLRALKREKQA